MEPNSYCGDECSRDGSCDCEYLALQDVLYNLDIKLPGRILVIGDIGTWRGRFSGYKILPGNVKNIFSSDCDYVEWYAENRCIKSTMHHHDGTNYLEYRVIREDRNIQNLLNKIYNQQEVSRQMINYYTRSLYPYIAEVYGW